jgi:hypothetical protein
MRVTILVLFLIAFFGNACAASNKDNHELQERCSKHAEDFFKRELNNGVYSDSYGTQNSTYANHYNRKLNKCFFLLSMRIVPHNIDNRKKILKQLWDISEHHKYGTFRASIESTKFQKKYKTTECNVAEKTCHFEDEWDALVKPYMEE